MRQLPFATLTECQYFGCTQPACRSNILLPPHCKKYCQHHSDEIDALFEKKKLPDIIAWKWASEGKKK